MKVIWEESDIQPGRRYGKPTIEERWWIIGYSVGSVDKQKLFHSVSLSDGMIGSPMSRSELATHLIESGYLPEELLPK